MLETSYCNTFEHLHVFVGWHEALNLWCSSSPSRFIVSCCLCISYQFEQFVCVWKYVWERLSTHVSISSEWSLREVDKLKMFLGWNPPEGLAMHAWLSSSIMIYFSKQWVTVRYIPLWIPTEKPNSFQCGSVMFIYRGAASMCIEPLQRKRKLYIDNKITRRLSLCYLHHRRERGRAREQERNRN